MTLTLVGCSQCQECTQNNTTETICDTEFDSAQQYEDAIAGNSSWATGDWNGDGDFDSSDFVAAFTAGGYELGPRGAVSAVPEPGSLALVMAGIFGVGMLRRRI